MCLDCEDGIEVIDSMYEKIDENVYWDLYVSAYPHMRKFVSFTDFRGKIGDKKPKTVDDKEYKDKLDKIDKLVARHTKKG